MLSKQITLNDGRKLGFAEYGNSSGDPILLFHGSPGSRYEVAVIDEHALDEGTRIIVVERPGYGLSTPKPDRTILDWANDVEELLNNLELLKVSIIGVSGGGPYAIACAARLGERVNRVAVICGMGPLDVPGGSEGISDEEKRLIQAARYAPEKMAEQIGHIHAHPEALAAEATGQLPEFDRSIITPDLVQKWLMGVKEATVSPEGMISDYKLFNQPWNVEFNEISVPIHFYHGDQDTTISLQHPRYLIGQLQDASLDIIEGAGHLGTAIVGTRRAIALLEEKRQA